MKKIEDPIFLLLDLTNIKLLWSDCSKTVLYKHSQFFLPQIVCTLLLGSQPYLEPHLQRVCKEGHYTSTVLFFV